jgi:hypothetical protein
MAAIERVGVNEREEGFGWGETEKIQYADSATARSRSAGRGENAGRSTMGRDWGNCRKT